MQNSPHLSGCPSCFRRAAQLLGQCFVCPPIIKLGETLHEVPIDKKATTQLASAAASARSMGCVV